MGGCWMPTNQKAAGVSWWRRLWAAVSGRDPRWKTVRAKHLADHPTCEACGEDEVEVHHIVPVEVIPERELDPANLITLCDRHGCHFAFGHLYDWRAWNPQVRKDARRQLIRVAHRLTATE